MKYKESRSSSWTFEEFEVIFQNFIELLDVAMGC